MEYPISFKFDFFNLFFLLFRYLKSELNSHFTDNHFLFTVVTNLKSPSNNIPKRCIFNEIFKHENLR